MKRRECQMCGAHTLSRRCGNCGSDKLMSVAPTAADRRGDEGPLVAVFSAWLDRGAPEPSGARTPARL